MNILTPQAIVDELDKHIVGQHAAKRAVAIALRNRWRRMQVDSDLRTEITPKNILMIGPTGVGKTEIARRLAKLAQAPFMKVEATKFTEVGYVGREVDSIIRDLADVAVKDAREVAMKAMQPQAKKAAENRVLDVLLPPARLAGEPEDVNAVQNPTREKFRQKLCDGELDDKVIEIEMQAPSFGVEIMAPPGMEEMTNQLQGMFQNIEKEKKQTRKLTIKNAMKQLLDEEALNLIDEEEIKVKALNSVEQQGIVFLDEIDKIAGREKGNGADISREGVQRDLLPLIEGATVSTKYGMIKTDHILFIASGAFHLSKPSDLVPELQGRLPIRVELDALSSEDFQRILTEPDAALIKQYAAMMQTEGLTLNFVDSAIEHIARIAWRVNDETENIGARRLHTVMERLLESLSFSATERSGETVNIDHDYVEEHLGELVNDEDLSRYIL